VSDSLRAVRKVAGVVVLTLVVCFALVAGLAACGGDDSETLTTTEAGIAATTAGSAVTSDATEAVDDSLVGKWTSAALAETIEFTADGDMIVSSEGEDDIDFTYTVDEGVITLGMEGTADTTSFSYTVDGDVLTIEDPDMGPTSYDRVK
jgi:hypothetical protein